MTDTEHGRPVSTRLQHPGPDLHPADPTDDLTGNTESNPSGLPVEDAPDGTLELTDDAAELTDGVAAVNDGTPGDGTAGDGTAGEPTAHGDVDALRTAVRGRETDAAEANLSDEAPTPQETPAD
jgi:hypothetical protein